MPDLETTSTDTIERQPVAMPAADPAAAAATGQPGNDNAAPATVVPDDPWARVPEDASGYELKFPDDFEAPDGVEEFTIDPDDPVLADTRAFAKEIGLTQGQFSKMLTFEARRLAAEGQMIADRVAEEAKKLGEGGRERVDNVQAWLKARLGDDLAEALGNQMYLAKQIQAFEKLMSLFRTGGVPGDTGVGRDNGPDEVDYSKMSFEERVERARSQPKKR